jgi:hypothetical protein
MKIMKLTNSTILTSLAVLAAPTNGLVETSSRRAALGWIGGACAGIVTTGAPSTAWGASAVQDSVNVDSFMRTGVDSGGGMGVSSQAGKSRPETGVFFRYATSFCVALISKFEPILIQILPIL